MSFLPAECNSGMLHLSPQRRCEFAHFYIASADSGVGLHKCLSDATRNVLKQTRALAHAQRHYFYDIGIAQCVGYVVGLHCFVYRVRQCHVYFKDIAYALLLLAHSMVSTQA